MRWVAAAGTAVLSVVDGLFLSGVAGVITAIGGIIAIVLTYMKDRKAEEWRLKAMERESENRLLKEKLRKLQRENRRLRQPKA